MAKRKNTRHGKRKWILYVLGAIVALEIPFTILHSIGMSADASMFASIVIIALAAFAYHSWKQRKKSPEGKIVDVWEPNAPQQRWVPNDSEGTEIRASAPARVDPTPKPSHSESQDLDDELAKKRAELLSLDDELLYQSFGLYRPRYAFSTVDGYKEQLKDVRAKQKQMIRDQIACEFPRDFTYNGKKSEGTKLVNGWIKLVLRAFNGECDAIILKAKFNNLEVLEKRIRKSAEEISKISARMLIRIQPSYIALKIDELHIAYEYELFKQQEKERLRAIREEEREKAKVDKELQEARDKIAKDQTHIHTEVEALQSRLATAGEDEAQTLRSRIGELEDAMHDLEAQMEDIDERSANARAGYVYVISNIGSFGENVYKIGMTRRLEPQERVDELGDASVPFRFDVHAFIFSTDAVKLEKALHQAFDDRRVNLVNTRKEFFAVSLDEIEREVKQNHSEVVEFTRTAAAQEYRESKRIVAAKDSAA